MSHAREFPVSQVPSVVSGLESDIRILLCDLVRLHTLPGHEQPAIELLGKWFRTQGLTCDLIPIDPDIVDDPDYSFGDEPFDYRGRHNLLVTLRGDSDQPGIILCSHVDVVPAPDWPEAFTPIERDGLLYGRGACDAKGQVVVIALVLKVLRDLGWDGGSVHGHIVVEEEPGGNGALAVIRAMDARPDHRPEAALILEGTNFHVHPANRGAIWFRLKVRGRSIHMARRHDGVNAIDKMAPLISALLEYEQRLVAQSRGQPLFEEYENPVQVNLGKLQAGSWPSMVAGEAVLEGGVGFLPNKRMEQIQAELREVIERTADDWTRAHYSLEFPRLHNDAYASDPGHPFVQALHQAAVDCGLPSRVSGWIASCDARLYYHRGGIPAVVFGPGDIAVAHSNQEHIAIADILKAVEVIVRAMMLRPGL